MADIHVDKSSGTDARSGVVEIEREVTKRAMIQAVTEVVVIVLYMFYSFVRGRDPGVVALDGADDWD